MTSTGATSVVLAADARNVSRARTVVRDALEGSAAEEYLEPAMLAVSELVTNAFVHAGTEITLVVTTVAGGVRVAVQDGGSHLPTRRRYADTAGTGRGLQLVEELAERWGVEERADGKVVWCEIGAVGPPASDVPGQTLVDDDARARGDAPIPITLRQVPLLMHLAWQEHAATLLREHLLHTLDEDDSLERHAQASDALSVLAEQLPTPVLSDDPDALMADAIEPVVTADELVLRVPAATVAHFETLDALLARAIREAGSGSFLSPPTQPEIDEMRQWFCHEVARQAAGDLTATPWVARTDVRATLADQAELTATYASLADVDEPLLATNEASIIVAASPAALDVLGYERADDLLGRRVIVVVPARFHQAHITGTTLNATNGRDKLLGVPITVPMLRADGVEVQVDIEVRPQRLDNDHRVFVARFRPS